MTQCALLSFMQRPYYVYCQSDALFALKSSKMLENAAAFLAMNPTFVPIICLVIPLHALVLITLNKYRLKAFDSSFFSLASSLLLNDTFMCVAAVAFAVLGMEFGEFYGEEKGEGRRRRYRLLCRCRMGVPKRPSDRSEMEVNRSGMLSCCLTPICALKFALLWSTVAPSAAHFDSL